MLNSGTTAKPFPPKVAGGRLPGDRSAASMLPLFRQRRRESLLAFGRAWVELAHCSHESASIHLRICWCRRAEKGSHGGRLFSRASLPQKPVGGGDQLGGLRRAPRIPRVYEWLRLVVQDLVGHLPDVRQPIGSREQGTITRSRRRAAGGTMPGATACESPDPM